MDQKLRKKVLMVYRHEQPPEKMRLALRKHLEVLEYRPDLFEVSYYNAIHDAPVMSFFHPDKGTDYSIPKPFIDKRFDVIILHDTFLGWRWWGSDFYDVEKKFEWLSKNGAIMIALPQDEYDHAEVLDEWLFNWDIDAVFTVCGLKNSDILFPLTKRRARMYESLTGYIDSKNLPSVHHTYPSHKDRPFDIVYRSQKLPYSFGSHGQLKHLIADIVSESAMRHNLHCDISTDKTKTVLGSKWLGFLSSGRCTIGTESGSSVIDFRGEKQALIGSILVKNPDLSFDEMSERLGQGWENEPITAISPRHFEAITTKTCQILLEGDYNNILTPGKHYISLKKDYSNLDDILESIQDYYYTETIVENAYCDIVESGLYDYSSFAEMIRTCIAFIENDREARKKGSAMSSDEKTSIDLLQREIIALRHENARLSAKIYEAQFSGMTGVVRYVKWLMQQFIEKKY